jgi:hypothetical protein
MMISDIPKGPMVSVVVGWGLGRVGGQGVHCASVRIAGCPRPSSGFLFGSGLSSLLSSVSLVYRVNALNDKGLHCSSGIGDGQNARATLIVDNHACGPVHLVENRSD